MKQNKNKFIWMTPIFVSILFFGILCGIYLTNWFVLKDLQNNKVQFSFDIVGIFNLIITTLFAFIIKNTIEKSYDMEKVDKDQLIKYLQSFEKDFTKQIANIAKNETKLTYATTILRRYRMRLNRLVSMIKKHNFLLNEVEDTSSLDFDLKKIIDLITNTPVKQGDVADGVDVRDGKLYFSERQLDLITDALLNFNCEIFETIVKINHTSR